MEPKEHLDTQDESHLLLCLPYWSVNSGAIKVTEFTMYSFHSWIDLPPEEASIDSRSSSLFFGQMMAPDNWFINRCMNNSTLPALIIRWNVTPINKAVYLVCISHESSPCQLAIEAVEQSFTWHLKTPPWRRMTNLQSSVSCGPCSTMKRSFEPTAVLFFLKLIGLGVKKQTFCLSILLVLNFVSLVTSFPEVYERSKFEVCNDLFERLVAASSILNILMKRDRMKIIIEQICLRLSGESVKKLKKLDCLLCIFLSLMWLFYLLILALTFKLRINCQENVLLGSWSVNGYIFWTWTIIFDFFFFSLNSLLFSITIALYTWVYVSLYLHKTEESHRFTLLMPNERKTLLFAFIDIEKKHESFESTFSLLLFLVTAYLFGAMVTLISTIGLSSSSSKTAALVTFALKTLLEVSAFATMVTIINTCQDQLRLRSIDVQNFFYLDETLGSAKSLPFLFPKLKSVLETPVTMWGMVNVSKGLVLGTCSSILTFSVLFVQIDHGSLKTTQ